MIESRSLQKIMELGYNVQMECKGKGRNYEMSFEATASRIMQEDEDYKEYVLSTLGKVYFAVGNTIEETAYSLLKQIQ